MNDSPGMGTEADDMSKAGSLRLLISMIALATAAVTAYAAQAPREWKIVRIGIDMSNPPFSSIDGENTPGGFDVAIARALCDRLKIRCDFVPAARAALLPDLLARRSDAVVSSVPMTEENRKTVDFTDRYYSMDGRFLVARTNTLTTITPETLRGKAIGAIESTPYATYLTEAYGSKGAIVKLYRTEADARTDLRDGRIAALFGNAIRLYRWVDDGSGSRCCRFFGPDVRNPKILGDGAGIAVRKEDGDLRDLLNRALADILRDGTYDKINAMYFNFLVY